MKKINKDDFFGKGYWKSMHIFSRRGQSLLPENLWEVSW